MADDRTPDLDLIGSSEAAAIVKVHVATIARWAADGTLPIAARLAGKTNPLLFHRADVERIAVERRAQNPADAPNAAGIDGAKASA